mgnify:CR=1 FL=1
MKNDTRHNGWANYETWRIALEVFDGQELYCTNPSPAECEEYAYEMIFPYQGLNYEHSLANSYAAAFLDAVDWREISESMKTED